MTKNILHFQRHFCVVCVAPLKRSSTINCPRLRATQWNTSLPLTPFCDIRLQHAYTAHYFQTPTHINSRATTSTTNNIVILHHTITHILYHPPRLPSCPIHCWGYIWNVCKAIFSNITIISKICKCFITCTESLKDSEMKYTFSFQL